MLGQAAFAAQLVTFDDVLTEAVKNSYELKLAQIDYKIARSDIKILRADYFPTMRAQWNSEYLRALEQVQQQVAVVGNTIIPGSSRFQNALSLVSNYTLWDFGVRGKNLAGAKRHSEAVSAQGTQQKRNLKLKLVDLYAECLWNYKGLLAKQRALTFYQQLFAIKRRLYDAGTISKVDVSDQALRVAKTFDEINELKQAFVENLKAISVYTQTTYDPEATMLKDFDDESASSSVFVAEDTPEYKFYQLEIERKKLELQAISRQRLPQIGLYSYYLFYGSDPTSPGRAISDFHQRTVSGGISLSVPLFDGFKNSAERAKKRLEISRLETERDQKLWHLRQEYERMATDAGLYKVQMSTKATILSQGEEKAGMCLKLSDTRVTDKTAWLMEQAELAEREFKLQKASVQRIASIKKLELLCEG